MLAALAGIMPDFVRQIIDALKTANPVLLIVIGAILFFFSGALKWATKWIGAGLVVYGLLMLLGYL